MEAALLRPDLAGRIPVYRDSLFRFLPFKNPRWLEPLGSNAVRLGYRNKGMTENHLKSLFGT